MLTRVGPRVVFTKWLESRTLDGDPVYGCLVPVVGRSTRSGDNHGSLVGLDGDAPGTMSRAVYRESQLVPPDDAALRRALTTACASGEGKGIGAAVLDALLNGYVWTVTSDPGPSGMQLDVRLCNILASGDHDSGEHDGALIVFTDLERANAACAARRIPVVAARVPFVVACRLADLLGRSDRLVVNPGFPEESVFDRELYLLMADAVVGYDLRLRPLPPLGLAPEWLEPIRAAVAAEPGLLEAYAWMWVGPGGNGSDALEALGLVVDPALGPGAFERVRRSVRARALALGLPDERLYVVAEIGLGAPHTTDDRHVIPLKRAVAHD